MVSSMDCKFTCKCSWKYDGDVHRSVSFGSRTEKCNADTNLSQMVQLETCIQLSRTHDDTPCTLSIDLEDPSVRLIKVSVASEARNIEVYGLHEEYLTTVKAENIDDYEGIVVNLAEIDVKPVHKILLKFAGIKHPNTMWLFGVRLVVDDSTTSKLAQGSSKVNYEAVEERLKMARVPITEKAERCKQFLREYTEVTNSCTEGKRQPDPATFLHLMDEAQRRPKVQNTISDGIADLTINDKQTPVCSSSVQQEIEELKLYIDTSLKKLENRITEYFDDQIRQLEMEQNNKLDSILVMLKDRFAFTKPNTMQLFGE